MSIMPVRNECRWCYAPLRTSSKGPFHVNQKVIPKEVEGDRMSVRHRPAETRIFLLLRKP